MYVSLRGKQSIMAGSLESKLSEINKDLDALNSNIDRGLTLDSDSYMSKLDSFEEKIDGLNNYIASGSDQSISLDGSIEHSGSWDMPDFMSDFGFMKEPVNSFERIEFSKSYDGVGDLVKDAGGLYGAFGNSAGAKIAANPMTYAVKGLVEGGISGLMYAGIHRLINCVTKPTGKANTRPGLIAMGLSFGLEVALTFPMFTNPIYAAYRVGTKIWQYLVYDKTYKAIYKDYGLKESESSSEID